MSTISDRELNQWLTSFASCVRDRDLDRARGLFAADAAGFGTVAPRYAGLDDLIDAQWADVWPRTEDFTFDEVEHVWSEGDQCATAVTWHSVGVDEGDRRTRDGRATLVLRRTADGLVAVHSHFSMTPGTRP